MRPRSDRYLNGQPSLRSPQVTLPSRIRFTSSRASTTRAEWRRLIPDDRRPMLIEFLGAPGTGKTTLARTLAQDLCARGYPATFVSMDAEPGLGRFAKAGRDLLEIGPQLVANPGQLRAAV